MKIPSTIQEKLDFIKIYFKLRKNPLYLYEIFRENSSIKLLNSISITPRIILDVGAHKGKWTDSLYKILSSKSKYYLIEPNKDSFRFLSNKYSKINNIFLYNYGISSTNCEKTFNYSNSDDFSSFEKFNESIVNQVFSSEYKYIKTETVECLNLDSFYQKYLDGNYIDILKIDTQGHEIEVLRGALYALKNVKYIIIEWNIQNLYLSKANFTNIHNTLTNSNFTLVSIPNQYIENHRLIYADAIYVNNEILN